MNVFNQVLLFASIPASTMVIGGIIATLKKPGGNVRSLVLHFAAGVVFSVVAVEILPDIIKNHRPLLTISGFIPGVLVMLAVRKLTEGKDKTAGGTASTIPWPLITGVGLDILIDGVLLGIGFAAGNKEGILLAVALSLELLSLGMATATELANNHIPVLKAITVVIGLALVFFTSSVLGGTILQNASHNVMDTVLSFGLAALLFLVIEELLKEAHEEHETVWHTSAFFGGFLAFVILGMYV